MNLLAPDLAQVTTIFVNAYLVGHPDGPWALVDTGMSGQAGVILAAARERFGPGRPPEAIVLTHGHIDHAGNARELAEAWGGHVPIFAAEAELPFLNGRADYAPGDPTVGGFMGFMSRFLPARGQDLRPFLQPLPADGSVPGMPGWRRIDTPGHSPGHAAFFRETDRTLLAGDTLATTDLQSWIEGGVTWRPRVSRPPLPFTPDWPSARESVETVLALRPARLLAGHGNPIGGDEAMRGLARLAAAFRPPSHGRYAHQPARPVSPDGFIPLPPAPPDPLPLVLAGVGVLATVSAGIYFASRLGERRGKVRRIAAWFD